MLEYTQRKYSPFAITMRKTTYPQLASKADYEKQMAYFKKNLLVEFDHISYENTSGLHLHGIVRIPIETSLIRFRVRGWSIKLEEIYDYAGWMRYINKDAEEDEDLTITPKEEYFPIPKIKLFGNV